MDRNAILNEEGRTGTCFTWKVDPDDNPVVEFACNILNWERLSMHRTPDRRIFYCRLHIIPAMVNGVHMPVMFKFVYNGEWVCNPEYSIVIDWAGTRNWKLVNRLQKMRTSITSFSISVSNFICRLLVNFRRNNALKICGAKSRDTKLLCLISLVNTLLASNYYILEIRLSNVKFSGNFSWVHYHGLSPFPTNAKVHILPKLSIYNINYQRLFVPVPDSIESTMSTACLHVTTENALQISSLHATVTKNSVISSTQFKMSATKSDESDWEVVN
uniref:DOMON domain-containing protein n=1 Tax=Heterorhabditis bacteriophora TaxID=37862 RepID=A0A1I7X1X2_HETBA